MKYCNNIPVSVVMCVKDGQDFLEETLKSVLNQTHSVFEFIVVVNCSNDRSLDILKAIKDDRLEILTSSLCQLAFNLNLALTRCRFDYVMRIDADDVCVPKRLETQLGLILEHDYDVVGSNVQIIDYLGRSKGVLKFPERNKQIRRQIWFRSVLAHPSVLYRKSVIMDSAGYFGDRESEDYDLWLRLMRKKNVIFYNCQKNLILYRVHENQSKGSRFAYAEVSGKLFREFSLNLNFLFFLGSFVYFLKSIFSRFR